MSFDSYFFFLSLSFFLSMETTTIREKVIRLRALLVFFVLQNKKVFCATLKSIKAGSQATEGGRNGPPVFLSHQEQMNRNRKEGGDLSRVMTDRKLYSAAAAHWNLLFFPGYNASVLCRIGSKRRGMDRAGFTGGIHLLTCFMSVASISVSECGVVRPSNFFEL